MKQVYFILNRCIHFLLAVQVLNLSFSNVNKEEPIFAIQGIENNEIDSAIEFLTEHILGWDNFIPEKDKAHQDTRFIKVSSCCLYCEKQMTTVERLSFADIKGHSHFIPGLLEEHSREINPPPPKAIIIG